MKQILVLVGSLRHGSFNLQLARALERLAASRLVFNYAPIDMLPHYNDDLWAAPPESVLSFKRLIHSSDGILLVSPEYNRSIPGVLKNALDWASRPIGENAWGGKRVAIAGASRGAIGTAVAQSHLRSILPVLDMELLPQPEVYLQFKEGLIAKDFEITVATSRDFLASFVDAFASWVSGRD